MFHARRSLYLYTPLTVLLYALGPSVVQFFGGSVTAWSLPMVAEEQVHTQQKAWLLNHRRQPKVEGQRGMIRYDTMFLQKYGWKGVWSCLAQAQANQSLIGKHTWY